ncbi:MAG: hypothetical protein L5656_02300 [Thermanaeromonas sp.]|uniref:hypothetical protein n=1 Tax=Thermanaeromonas sp. TaxID=2003697 RepID=UPI002439DD43|nr:hypothetical protein [Thermanaeromonas sp.]MCG0277355.1 hypothetical protein [Thermanaeromonas sp.]
MAERLKFSPAEQLEQALAADRLSHAYLLVGGSLEERLEVARRVAAALNCLAGKGGQACGLCPSCRQMLGGNHPDFHYLEPRGASLKIDQVRKLELELRLKAFQGRAKVAVLSRVEDLTLEAANCLLKILEEPPPGVYFFLLAAQPDAVLPTIRSRCQVVYLPSRGLPSVGWLYWQEILSSDLRRLMVELLPRLEREEDLRAVIEGLILACREHLVWELTGEEGLLFSHGFGQGGDGLSGSECPPGPDNIAGDRPVSSGEDVTRLDSRWIPPEVLWRCYKHLNKARIYLEQNANRRLLLEVSLLNLYRELKSGSI